MVKTALGSVGNGSGDDVDSLGAGEGCDGGVSGPLVVARRKGEKSDIWTKKKK